jgi:hypothetical protein
MNHGKATRRAYLALDLGDMVKSPPIVQPRINVGIMVHPSLEKNLDDA